MSNTVIHYSDKIVFSNSLLYHAKLSTTNVQVFARIIKTVSGKVHHDDLFANVMYKETIDFALRI